MYRRIAALIFVLGIVGQAWASSCVCDDSRPVHYCCLRKAEKNDYFSTKPCCDEENCVSQRTSTPPAGLGEATASPAEYAEEAPGTIAFAAPGFITFEPVRSIGATGSYRYRPRPPDLYVRHHAFRI